MRKLYVALGLFNAKYLKTFGCIHFTEKQENKATLTVVNDEQIK